ncbi:metallophosphoesterase [Cryobacterium sp. BB307]|uniref:metallophosphoesterase n=1 Tax=Cryobacterium sp. BB307 TaxID=2716317 RepID=UPI0014475CD0|nr:metallophosphoesterase [Cryobacterium sp. BB307]
MGAANRVIGGALATVGAAALGALAWGTVVERNRFTVRREVVQLLDPSARPITVLHLADLHLAPWQRTKIDWVRELAVLEPDFIVNTGDTLGHTDALDAVAYALEPFRGIPGVFVHGSNDYIGPEAKNPFAYLAGESRPGRDGGNRLDTAGLEELYRDLGWYDLNNAARAIEFRGSRLELVGTGDAHRGWDRLDLLPGIVDDLRENVGWEDDRVGPAPVTIGVTHAPYQRVLNSLVNHGADMIFAGHTHGGQVRVPGYGALVANCDIPLDQANGLSTWHHAGRMAHLNVSAGLGTSIYAPVRFACPPEAVLVTLTADDFGYS